MAKVNDLQCIGDALIQGNLKVNGEINKCIFDIDPNIEVHFFAKKLDCTTVGNKVTLFEVPAGYYGVSFEAPYIPTGPLNMYGTIDTSTSPTQASIAINSTYNGSSHTSSSASVPMNGGATISGLGSGSYLLEEGAVEAEVIYAGNNNATAYLSGIYMLIPTA